MHTVVVIPAVKKKVAFTNDLVKKLAGTSLIQRAINKAKSIVTSEDIYIITDSEEIKLICQRNGINVYYDKKLGIKSGDLYESIKKIIIENITKYQDTVLLSPYAPLIKVEEIQKAFDEYKAKKSQLLVPVKRGIARVFESGKKNVKDVLNGSKWKEVSFESRSFKIFSNVLIINGRKDDLIIPVAYEMDHDLVDIWNYQDWWICEKLLKRKRIVFHFIGHAKVGMGHIYRSLSLANAITDHEVRFVCDKRSETAANKLVGYDYWLGIFDPKEIVDQIIALKPDLVINDILDTDQKYIRSLRNHGIKVINFEDLGSGASSANLTINELYSEPSISGENILWGSGYFFLREEFNDSKVNRFRKNVRNILITFGGTDQNNYTQRVLENILEFCKKERIKIFIVTGPGYLYIKKLKRRIAAIDTILIEYTHATGVMSHIMEQVEIAITSNGRTVYELAHMNIPSIVLSHHERENAHLFATEMRGFIPLGVYSDPETEERLLTALTRLVKGNDYSKLLFNRLKSFKFDKNKEKVEKLLMKTVEGQVDGELQ